MYPSLFGQDILDMYNILIALGVLACLVLFRILSDKLKVETNVFNFYLTTAVVSIVIGFISAFLFQQVYNYIDFLKNAKPNEKFEWRGMTFMGGLIGGVATFIIVTIIFAPREAKDGFWQIANIAAPCITIAHAFGRLGCFCAGCCYGIRSDNHGIKFPDLRHKVIPTNLYESLFLFVLTAALIVALFKLKDKRPIIIIYAFAYSIFRFILEFYRGDSRGTLLPILTPSQWQSVLIFSVAVALTILIYRFNIIPFQKRNKNKVKTDGE